MASGISLVAIRTRYVKLGRPLPRALEDELRADGRSGAKAILEAVEKRRHAHRAEGQRLRKMLAFEQELWTQASPTSLASTKQG